MRLRCQIRLRWIKMAPRVIYALWHTTKWVTNPVLAHYRDLVSTAIALSKATSLVSASPTATVTATATAKRLHLAVLYSLKYTCSTLLCTTEDAFSVAISATATTAKRNNTNRSNRRRVGMRSDSFHRVGRALYSRVSIPSRPPSPLACAC